MSGLTSLHSAATLEGGVLAMEANMVSGNDYDIDAQIRVSSRHYS